MTHLHGATLGQQHRKSLCDALEGYHELGEGAGALLVVDFAGVLSVTASYLKPIVLAFIRAGIHFAEGSVPADPRALPPLNVFPVVTALSAEIAEELSEVLNSSRLLCLEALEHEGSSVGAARLLGTPEPSIVQTLDALVNEESATAGQLCERYPMNPPITPNAWSNKLAELYRLRLASRVRTGRQLIYSPIAKRVLHG